WSMRLYPGRSRPQYSSACLRQVRDCSQSSVIMKEEPIRIWRSSRIRSIISVINGTDNKEEHSKGAAFTQPLYCVTPLLPLRLLQADPDMKWTSFRSGFPPVLR